MQLVIPFLICQVDITACSLRVRLMLYRVRMKTLEEFSTVSKYHPHIYSNDHTVEKIGYEALTFQMYTSILNVPTLWIFPLYRGLVLVCWNAHGTSSLVCWKLHIFMVQQTLNKGYTRQLLCWNMKWGQSLSCYQPSEGACGFWAFLTLKVCTSWHFQWTQYRWQIHLKCSPV